MVYETTRLIQCPQRPRYASMLLRMLLYCSTTASKSDVGQTKIVTGHCDVTDSVPAHSARITEKHMHCRCSVPATTPCVQAELWCTSAHATAPSSTRTMHRTCTEACCCCSRKSWSGLQGQAERQTETVQHTGTDICSPIRQDPGPLHPRLAVGSCNGRLHTCICWLIKSLTQLITT